MERKTINVNIKSNIYEELSSTATSTSTSKTKIIEKALVQYLGIDSSTSTQDEELSIYNDVGLAKEISNLKQQAADLMQRMGSYEENCNNLQNKVYKNGGELEDLKLQVGELEGNSVNQQQLDERIAQSIEPVWDAILTMGDFSSQAEQQGDQSFAQQESVNSTTPEFYQTSRLSTIGMKASNHEDNYEDSVAAKPQVSSKEEKPEMWKTIQLAKRLKVTTTTIRYHLNERPDSFQKWTKKRDPEGFAWQFFKVGKQHRFNVVQAEGE
jgi:chromosome segregation ATPase